MWSPPRVDSGLPDATEVPGRRAGVRDAPEDAGASGILPFRPMYCILVKLPGQGGDPVWARWAPGRVGLVGRARPGRVSDHPPEKREGDTPDRVDAS